MATAVGTRPQAFSAVRDSRGMVIEDTYLVRDALNPVEAILASGMPAYGDPSPIYPESKVNRFQPLQLLTETDYEVRVTWSPPGWSIPAASYQIVEWNNGTQGQDVLTDVDGEQIGSRYFAKAIQAYQMTPWKHDGAVLGANVQVPLLQAEVKMASPHTFNPLLVYGLIGKSNATNFLIDGVTIAPDYAILIGARATRTAPQPANQYDVSYLFAIGQIELPNLPTYQAWDGEPWTRTHIPINCGYSARFQAMKDADTPARNESEITQTKALYQLVHRLYKPGNLAALGIT